MINIEEKDSETIQLNLEGEVTSDDYKKIRPQLEALFAKDGRKKFLFNMKKVKDFTLGAIYQDIKFDLLHFKYIGTTAVVSTKEFAETMTQAADSLYPVKIERFDDVMTAFNWLKLQKT